MNFKFTTFKTVFSAIIALLIGGLSYGFAKSKFQCLGPCGPQTIDSIIIPYVVMIIVIIITFGILYTLESLSQK